MTTAPRRRPPRAWTSAVDVAGGSSHRAARSPRDRRWPPAPRRTAAPGRAPAWPSIAASEGDAEHGGPHRAARSPAPRPRAGVRRLHGCQASWFHDPLGGRARSCRCRARRRSANRVRSAVPSNRAASSTTTALARNVRAEPRVHRVARSPPKSTKPLICSVKFTTTSAEGPPRAVHQAEGNEAEPRGQAHEDRGEEEAELRHTEGELAHRREEALHA